VRNAPGVASRAVRPIVSRALDTSEATARNLLVHCAQEMNHLARFLPELYGAFSDE
jgi:DAPG hydrolase PhiG domain